MKRLLKILLFVVTLCNVFAVTVSADTTDYYFNLGGGTTDATKRTMKAGGSAYESIYYVRPTYFSRNQNYKVQPHRIITESNKPAVGGFVTIYWSNNNVLKKYTYGGACPSNYYYYLFANFIDGPTAQPIYVEGRYTP
ncbi:MAG: hypothetical protein Q4D16_07715 [Eubacteriales bacterium]|nr:hypothetical protein [Eubacteriales bacterium]